MTADVVVIGAGVVGAACAYHAARAGLAVTVLDSRTVAGGTSGAGEGNLLISDKLPGPELDLMAYSLRCWHAVGAALGPDAIELERKGGLVVAATGTGLAGLQRLAADQRTAGVRAEPVPADRLADVEPELAADLAGGVRYPEDCQVQPMLAAAAMLRDARARGATVRTGAEVTGVVVGRDGRITDVRVGADLVPAGSVVNAAGPWSGEVSRRLGAPLPVEPRRGFVLVTEPLPPLIRHKVYSADYVASVGSDDAGLQSAPVVEGTRSGTVLIGSSRERVGFDRALAVPVLRRLAAAAVSLFPVLGGVHAIRAYRGFRPYSPDHLPIIGPDPRVPGLLHATGHEGGGVGLAAGTGAVVAALLTGAAPELDLAPFRPERFGQHGATA